MRRLNRQQETHINCEGWQLNTVGD